MLLKTSLQMHVFPANEQTCGQRSVSVSVSVSFTARTHTATALSRIFGFSEGEIRKTLPLRTTHFVTLTPRCVWLFLGRSQQARKIFSSVSWKQYSTLRLCVCAWCVGEWAWKTPSRKL